MPWRNTFVFVVLLAIFEGPCSLLTLENIQICVCLLLINDLLS